MSKRKAHSSAPAHPEAPSRAPSGAFETGDPAVGRAFSTEASADSTASAARSPNGDIPEHGAKAPHSRMDERYQLRGPRRLGMLIFGITSAVVISSLAIALLYAKWYSSEDYTAMIVVYGEEAWDGAIVVVKGPSIAPNGLSAKLEADNNLMIRFHVPPGNYDVNIYKDGKPLLPQRRVTGLKADNWAWPYRQPSTTRKSTPAD